MKKASFIIVLLPLLALAAQARELSDTTENIHIALSFDYNVSTPAALASQVDYVWGAVPRKWTGPPYYSEAYFPYDRDPDPTHTLAYWQARHPDWIVYQCDRTTVAFEFGGPYVPLDITNPAVRAYQKEQLDLRISSPMAPSSYYDGFAWDNVTLTNAFHRCGVWRNGAWVPLHDGHGTSRDPLFSQAVLTWAQDLYTYAKSRHPQKTVSYNFDTVDDFAEPSFANLVRYFDGNFSERGFTAWGRKRSTDAEWTRIVAHYDYLKAQGKYLFIQGLVRVGSDEVVAPADVSWILGNYLLVKGNKTWTHVAYLTSDDVQHYGSFIDRPEFHIGIGHPTSGRYAYQNVQRRDYSNGTVLVNPSSQNSYTVVFPTLYRDLQGRMVSQVALSTASAVILLSTTSNTPSVTDIPHLAPKIYPNPWKISSNSPIVHFDGLSGRTTIKIFTLSGQWVRTLETSTSSTTWDLMNDRNKRVASGIYLCLITNDQGQNETHRLAIIR